jgi:hypothetical protein
MSLLPIENPLNAATSFPFCQGLLGGLASEVKRKFWKLFL